MRTTILTAYLKQLLLSDSRMRVENRWILCRRFWLSSCSSWHMRYHVQNKHTYSPFQQEHLLSLSFYLSPHDPIYGLGGGGGKCICFLSAYTREQLQKYSQSPEPKENCAIISNYKSNLKFFNFMKSMIT